MLTTIILLAIVISHNIATYHVSYVAIAIAVIQNTLITCSYVASYIVT